jgi:glutathione S-transferase
MVLIGMPDSPYVRRVAITLKLMGLPFEHRSVSVFRTYDEFRRINPVVKAPSFICNDGTVLMDSTLILDYLEHCVAPGKALTPAGGPERREALRLIGLAMAACEKMVQIVYEHNQRPPDKVHAPWLGRVTQQANEAFTQLEAACAKTRGWLQGNKPNAADVAVACAWRFSQIYTKDEFPEGKWPALVAFSARAEALPEFASTPPE